MIEVIPQAIPDVLLIKPSRFGDSRGFFSETYNQAALAEAGYRGVFVQDNHSLSEKAGTTRGLHMQRPPFAQDKLVRVSRGRILDVAVDLRRGSPSYGRHVAVEVSADNWAQLLAPAGFAHGFQTLTADTEVLYKVTAPYTPSAEEGLLWADEALGIAWPYPPSAATVNARDAAWPRLADYGSPFTYAAAV